MSTEIYEAGMTQPWALLILSGASPEGKIMSQPIPEYQLQSLLLGLASDEAKERESAVRAIEKDNVSDERIVSSLQKMASSDPYEDLRAYAASALRSLGQPVPISSGEPKYRPLDFQGVLRDAFETRAIFWIAASVILFAVACLLPAILTGTLDPSEKEWTSGIELLVFGWILVGEGQISWIANALLGAAWLLLVAHKLRWAIGAAILAFAVALDVFFFKGYYSCLDYKGCSTIPVIELGPGAFLWLGSLAVTLVGALVCYFQNRNHGKASAGE